MHSWQLLSFTLSSVMQWLDCTSISRSHCLRNFNMNLISISYCCIHVGLITFRTQINGLLHIGQNPSIARFF